MLPIIRKLIFKSWKNSSNICASFIPQQDHLLMRLNLTLSQQSGHKADLVQHCPAICWSERPSPVILLFFTLNFILYPRLLSKSKHQQNC